MAAIPAVPDIEGTESVTLRLDVPENTARLTIRLWERFGREVRLLLDESDPAPGPRQIGWDFRDDAGVALPPGGFVLRIVMDDRSHSRIVHRNR